MEFSPVLVTNPWIDYITRIITGACTVIIEQGRTLKHNLVASCTLQ